jgi:hypothetical protein
MMSLVEVKGHRMGIRRPSFYLASLLDGVETRALYDRLILESHDSETALLIPKVRRRSKSARRLSCANFYFPLNEAEKSAGADCRDDTKTQRAEKDRSSPCSNYPGLISDQPASTGASSSTREQNHTRRAAKDDRESLS